MGWIHRLLNPHCPHCIKEAEILREERKLILFAELETQLKEKQFEREEHIEERICQSCETLKMQLSIANQEKAQLLEKLLKEPPVVEDRKPQAVNPPKNLPWSIRKNMLEAEDRHKAQLMRNAPKPLSEIPPLNLTDSPRTIDDIEAELGLEDKANGTSS